jgi:hypothetical protein
MERGEPTTVRALPAPWLAPTGYQQAPRGALGVAVGLLLLGTLSACASAGPSATAGAAVRQTCQAVSAALSDGPDPSTDPVGYAEAQILPLRRIDTSDRPLQAAIDALAAAYQKVFDTNGSTAATAAVRRASHQVDTICPGATS